MNRLQIIANGIVKSNPTFVLVLGMCPTLGTTTSAEADEEPRAAIHSRSQHQWLALQRT